MKIKDFKVRNGRLITPKKMSRAERVAVHSFEHLTLQELAIKAAKKVTKADLRTFTIELNTLLEDLPPQNRVVSFSALILLALIEMAEQGV